ncbi:MAG TPA: ABC transporter substrate-binding protein [Acidimicrobiales bacterium]|jgi:NitT/TauT family transport system substrate-binding protein|nr:ABC transporter substrate-binding protein [Acidimicrobiales bacterium]
MAMAVVLAACGKDDKATTADSGGAAKPSTEPVVNLTLGGAHGTAHLAPVEIGIETGKYKACNIEVKFATFGGGGEILRAVTTGAVDLAAVATNAAIGAYAKATPLSVVAGAFQTSNRVIYIVKKDSPYKTVSDLSGHKVGITSPGSVSEILIKYALTRSNVALNKVQFVPVGQIPAGVAALESGAIDTTLLAYPDAATFDKNKFRVLLDADKFLKEHDQAFQQTVFASTASWSKDHADVAKRFANCTKGVYDYVKANVSEATATYARIAKVDPAAAKEVIEYHVANKGWTVNVNRKGVEFALASLKEQKAVPDTYSMKDLEPMFAASAVLTD